MTSEYNLILTGFMGTGKSTVGQIVAARLGRRFVDMDALIAQRAGRSVPEIWQEYGEAAFRAWEAALCKELSHPEGLVIATGGGALVPPENLNAIRGEGNVVIRLTASVKNVLDRLAAKQDRPLLHNPNANNDEHQRRKVILSLFERRRTSYESIRVRVDTTDLEPEAIADEVMCVFERELARNPIRTWVNSPTGQYDLLCQRGILRDLPHILRDYNLRGRVAVVTNDTLLPLYGDLLRDILPDAALISVPDGEAYKNLATVGQLYGEFVRAGLDRSGVVIAFGGGVIGDTAGYAAASFMRGVRLVQIPTSLLAMIDSSVGGKVGVDIPEGKNLVGAFKQPEVVILDPDLLHTLPEVELCCGLSEGIKHALLADPGLLECLDALKAGEPDILRRTIAVKVDYVQRDPYEAGLRAHLNLGHTFAHAVERVSHYQWRHGEAVGLGLVAAARLSHALGYLEAGRVEAITGLVREAGLPTRLSDYTPDALWAAMGTDKKWRNGQNSFIVLEDIGQPMIVENVPRETVMGVLESLYA